MPSLGLLRGRLVLDGAARHRLIDDLAVAHLHDAVAAVADAGVVGDEHAGQTVALVQLA